MRKLIGLLIAFAALAAAASSEEGPEGWLIPFAMAWRPPVAGFNRVLAGAGAPGARTDHFGWGMELRSLVGGNFLVGPLFFTSADEAHNDSFHLRVASTGVFGELGYRIGIARVITIVPMVGLGGLDQRWHLRRATPDGISLDSLLRRPESQVDFATKMKLTGMAALEIGFAASTDAGRFGLALRGGYLYSPFAPVWRTGTGSRVTGTPDVRLAGPFASVGLLFLPAAEVASSPAGLR